MRREKLRLLSIAVATGKVGFVFLIGNELKDWGISRLASTGPNQAKRFAKKWIDHMQPDVLVTEDVSGSCRKGNKSKLLIGAIANVSADAELLDVSVRRLRLYQNKYEEAASFAEFYPEIKSYLPKRPKLWQPEPRNMIYFEALALARYMQNTKR